MSIHGQYVYIIRNPQEYCLYHRTTLRTVAIIYSLHSEV